MYKVYACLLGKWTELTEDEYQIGYGDYIFSPANWLNNADIHSKKDFTEDSFYHLPIVKIFHKEKVYIISATLIQVVKII